MANKWKNKKPRPILTKREWKRVKRGRLKIRVVTNPQVICVMPAAMLFKDMQF